MSKYPKSDGRQHNNHSLGHGGVSAGLPSPTINSLNPGDIAGSMSTLTITGGTLISPNSNLLASSSQSVSLPAMSTLVAMPLPPIRHYAQHAVLGAVGLHVVAGRNVCVSSDGSIATRRVDEYNNAYVFTACPLRCGERLLVQILAVDHAYVGGLAFGMTSCDPAVLPRSPAAPPHVADLPDDSDLLLDRAEYWVVNKDVCASPEVGDELAFHFTDDGVIRYGKNGHNVATLMHLDKTLPMWAFFDVYGNTQKIRLVGIIGAPPAGSGLPNVQPASGLTVVLPPASHSPAPSLALSQAMVTVTSSITPPPRPPPPRVSPSTGGRSSPAAPPSLTPPLLPPKQHRTPPQPSVSLPAPLVPLPVSTSPANRPHTTAMVNTSPAVENRMPLVVEPRTLPIVETRTPAVVEARLLPHVVDCRGVAVVDGRACTSVDGNGPVVGRVPPAVLPRTRRNVAAPHQGTMQRSAESMDNASNECSVCFERATDCVLYTCGHMCVCYDCALDIKQNQGGLCPICRQPIRDIIKIFRS